MYGGDHARKFGNPHGQHGGFVQPAELEAKAAEDARMKAAAALKPFAADLRRLCGGNIEYENHRRYKAVVTQVVNGQEPAAAIRTVLHEAE